MFKSFNKFTEEVFKELSPEIQKLYGNVAKHRVEYLGNNGFDDWLIANENTDLTKAQLNSVVNTYLTYGDRKTSDIPHLFASLERYHNINIPAEEGIATKEYWDAKLSKNTEATASM